MSINDEISLLKETIQKLDESRHSNILQSCVSENIYVFEGEKAIRIGLQIGHLLNDKDAAEKVQKLLTSDVFFNIHKEFAGVYYYKEQKLNNYKILTALLQVLLRFYLQLSKQNTRDLQFLFAIVNATLINKVQSLIAFSSTE